MNAEMRAPDSATIELTLVSHTNAGKTTLARTLLGRDIGEVRDLPHVTEIAEAHTLAETAAGDVLRLWDTPGFGDSSRLLQRLRVADNPIGWLLREVWDRYRDRPFWCNQQAVRAARDSSDVVLYLVNAAEDPRDTGYVAPEMQVLRWVGKPVIVLLNQLGPPRAADAERADEERWRRHLEPFGIVGDVLTLDAFARCWVHERVLLDAVGRLLAPAKRAAHARLAGEWTARSIDRFTTSMRVLAEQRVQIARDREPVAVESATAMQKVLRSVGVGREGDAARETAMAALAARLDAQIRATTDRLIELHGLHGSAAQTVLERMRANFATKERVDEGKAALWGSVITGALTGLKAELAAGGLTFGAGMLVGGVIGGLTGAGVARGLNVLSGANQPEVPGRTSSSMVLRGRACCATSPLRTSAVVAAAGSKARRRRSGSRRSSRLVAPRTVHFTTPGPARESESEPGVIDLQRQLAAATATVLDRLYPGRVPSDLIAPRTVPEQSPTSVRRLELSGGDFAAIDEEHAVQHVARVREIGLRQHDRESFLLEPTDHLDQPLAQDRSDAFERLVEQQQPRAAHQRPRKRRKLLLAAGKLQRLALCEDLGLRNDRIDELQPLRGVGLSGRPRRQQHVLLDRQVRHQAAVFRHVADAEAGAAVHRQRRQRMLFEHDPAAPRGQDAHDAAHQRRLAGPVAADQAGELAGRDRQRDIAQDADRADRDVELFNAQHG
jgi:hypothetical protein